MALSKKLKAGEWGIEAVKNRLSLRFPVGKSFHFGEATFRLAMSARVVECSRARENFTPASW